MNWQGIGVILLFLGLVALLIGYSMQLWPKRQLLGVFVVALVAIALFSGDWQAFADDNADSSSKKASHYWLSGGWVCLLLGGITMLLATNLT